MILSVLPEGESAAAPTIDAAALFCKNRDGRIHDFFFIVAFSKKRPSMFLSHNLDKIKEKFKLIQRILPEFPENLLL